MTVESVYNQATPTERILGILACLIFLLIHLTAVWYMGFGVKGNESQPYVYDNPITQMGLAQFWILIVFSGAAAGAMMHYKRWAIAAVSGLVGAVGIAGFTLLYIFWRDSYEMFETIIMLAIGMAPGLMLYNFLADRVPVKTNRL